MSHYSEILKKKQNEIETEMQGFITEHTTGLKPRDYKVVRNYAGTLCDVIIYYRKKKNQERKVMRLTINTRIY